MGDPAKPDEPQMVTVPNPAYTALKDLHDDVVAAQDTLGKALKTPAQLMHSGDAWTGPTTAKAWGEEVAGRDQSLPGLVQQILHAIESEMSSTPQTMERPMNRGMYE
jgi:hypothetical protein